MADDSWLDDPSLYKPKASSSDGWPDDPQLYKPAKKVEKPGFGETLLKGLQRGHVGHRNARGAAGAAVAVVACQVQHAAAQRHLLVQRKVLAKAVLPVDGEA